VPTEGPEPSWSPKCRINTRPREKLKDSNGNKGGENRQAKGIGESLAHHPSEPGKMVASISGGAILRAKSKLSEKGSGTGLTKMGGDHLEPAPLVAEYNSLWEKKTREHPIWERFDFLPAQKKATPWKKYKESKKNTPEKPQPLKKTPDLGKVQGLQEKFGGGKKRG